MLSCVICGSFLQEFLTGRPAIEGGDLAQLVDREGARVKRRDLVHDLADARVHGVQQQRHDGIEVALEFRPALHDRRFEIAHDHRRMA